MRNYNLILTIFIALLFGCTNASTNTENRLTVKGDKFIDAQGREVILNGINHVVKNHASGYVYAGDEELFRQFKEWGFNAIRYGVIWDGLEPEPGVINEEYLKEIDKRVQWAEDNGLWLILDMHQDLFSRKYADGAPLWATLDEGEPHIEGAVWSDAYLISPAIHRAFDNFWANAEAPDGVGIQDHYINVLKVLAARYGSSPSVAGFDIMNEPFMGSGATDVMAKLLEGFGTVIAQKTGKIPSPSELLDLWTNEDKRIAALDMMNDKEIYLSIMQHAKPSVDDFEQGSLSDFYQKSRDAIRSTGSNQILFLEHNYFCNLGVESTFKIPTNSTGELDTLCAYAPHGYDLVTDTKGAIAPGYNRVDVIFDQIFLAAKKRSIPTIVGEWGAFYMGNNYIEPSRHLISIFEENLAGQTYWAWWKDIESQDYFLSTIVRPYPMAIDGNLISYNNNWLNGEMSCHWIDKSDSKGSGVSVIFVPNIDAIDKSKIKLEPLSKYEISKIDSTNSGYLKIDNLGGSRKLTISY